jgi:DNA-binding NtrC family response regulator
VVSGVDPSFDRRLVVERFSEALYAKLCLVQIFVPPLRERREDVEAIADAWLARRHATGGTAPVLSPMARATLRGYHWPENVDELIAILDRAAALARGRAISGATIDAALGRRASRLRAADVLTLDHVECEYILTVVERCNGNRSLAARRLGIGRVTLLRKLRACEKLRRCRGADGERR